MKKNFIKIILDILMFVLLILMFNKNVISMSFHEVGGLIVCGLFLIHMGLNRKWILGISKRIFDKSLSGKTRLGYIVNAMLFIFTALIAISGIMISKTIFGFQTRSGVFWQSIHYFTASLDIILIGIHIGLHWTFIKNMFTKIIKIPHTFIKPIGIICISIILIYGGYSTVTTDFTRWLSLPFTTSSVQKGNISENHGKRSKEMPNNDEGPENFIRPEVKGNPGESNGGRDFSIGRIIEVITSYSSIILLFSFLTIMIEKILRIKISNRLENSENKNNI